MEAVFSIEPSGVIRCLWNELFPLRELGTLDVQRASSIEFNPASGQWDVRWTGSDAVVFSHGSRDKCIEWEQEQFNERLATA